MSLNDPTPVKIVAIETTSRFVRIKKFCELTGYSQKAVYHKIADGVWMQNREYRRGPDSAILIDMEGFQRWVLGARAAA